MINEPPPLNRDYDRDPNIKSLKRRGFIKQGSTLVWQHKQQTAGGNPLGKLAGFLEEISKFYVIPIPPS